MATILFIFILLSGYHFVMETLIIPALRIPLSNKLISLNDRLIRLKLTNPAEINYKTFSELSRFIYTTVKHLDEIGLFTILFFSRKNALEDKAFKEKLHFLNNSGEPEIKEIFDQAARTGARSVVINSLSWAIYLLPFLVISLLLTFTLKQLAKMKELFIIKKTEEIIFIIMEDRRLPEKEPEYCRIPGVL
jgi:hypothetical protein